MATAVSEDEEDRAREKEGHPERKPVTDRKGWRFLRNPTKRRETLTSIFKWPTLIELFQVDRRAILDGYPQVLVDDVTSKGRIAVRFSGMMFFS